MTKVNFNFVNDVCYLGASELANSFENVEPVGLRKFVGDYETIYNALHLLPETMKRAGLSLTIFILIDVLKKF